VPWDIHIVGEAWRALLLLPPPEVDFFFCLFFMGIYLFFVGLYTRGFHRRATHAPENEERKKKNERNSFFLTL